jgi:hypothetical protein
MGGDVCGVWMLFGAVRPLQFAPISAGCGRERALHRCPHPFGAFVFKDLPGGLTSLNCVCILQLFLSCN